jgi:uncharacterized membrane protein
MKAPARDPAAGTERAISRILRIGVTASLVALTAGTLLAFIRGGGYGGQPAEVARLIGPAGAFPRTAAWILGGLLRLDGRAVIVTGLLLLIATPVLRVAVSIVSFAKERDRTFVVITSAVLGLLLLSLVLGRAG